MEEINQSISGDFKSSEENLSIEDYIRIGLESEGSESTEEEVESNEEDPPEVESEELNTEEEPEFEEDDETEEEERSEVDILSLSAEQIQELAKKGKSRFLHRIGELTAKNKALEERARQLEEQKPRIEVAQEENPFSNISSVDEVKEKYKELEATLNTTDALLEDHEEYAADDLITVGDKEFTKRQIRTANRNAREALTKFLPAQQQYLAKVEHLKTVAIQYQEAVTKEVPEVMDETSPLGQQYKALLADPLVQKVKNDIPELGVQIEYLVAHALRSISRQNAKVSTGAGSKLKVSPPASPVGVSSTKGKMTNTTRLQQAFERAEQTGRMEDYIAARTLEEELTH